MALSKLPIDTVAKGIEMALFGEKHGVLVASTDARDVVLFKRHCY